MCKTSIRVALAAAWAGATCVLLAALLAGCYQESQVAQTPSAASAGNTSKSSPDKAAPSQPAPPKAQQAATTPKAGGESVKLGSCDGENTVEVSKALAGQALADALMDQWKRNHPEANWVTVQKEQHAIKPPADNADLLKGSQRKGDAYGNFSPRDLLTWRRETEKFVAEGSRIFHDADALGSTVAVSCDMCHPNAANTHPETYPKFQTQLGRAALLRDMINWCIENPLRGKKLDPDGPKMRALEAYILSQRKGVPMNYGKH
jgi:hypothetical protein